MKISVIIIFFMITCKTHAIFQNLPGATMGLAKINEFLNSPVFRKIENELSRLKNMMNDKDDYDKIQARAIANQYVLPKYSCEEIYSTFKKAIEIYENNRSFCMRDYDHGPGRLGPFVAMTQRALDNCVINVRTKIRTVDNVGQGIILPGIKFVTTRYYTDDYFTYVDPVPRSSELICRNLATFLLHHEKYLIVGYVAEFCSHIISECDLRMEWKNKF